MWPFRRACDPAVGRAHHARRARCFPGCCCSSSSSSSSCRSSGCCWPPRRRTRSSSTTTRSRSGHGISCGVNWDELTSFQGDVILLWLRNSAVYAFLALAITLAVGIPAGYAMAMMEFPGRRALLVITLVVMLMPTTTLVVPLFLEINEVHLVGITVVGRAAVLVLPVRRLPDLYLLQHRAAARPAGRGPHRRLHGVRGVPPRRAAAGRADHRAGGLLQLRGELDQLLPALRDAAAKQPVPGPGWHRHCC